MSGPSSNVSLIRTIFQALVRCNLVRVPLAFPPVGLNKIPVLEGHGTTLPKASALPSNTSYLPPHHETELLLQHFFSTTGVLFPYIHKDSFMQTYESLKAQSFRGKVRRIWLALLNVMLAMATCERSQENFRDTTKAAKSHAFYQRSQELCDEQILHGTTLETGKRAMLCSLCAPMLYLHFIIVALTTAA